MAKNKNDDFNYFAFIPPETEVELVSFKGDKSHVTPISYKDALLFLEGKHPTMEKRSKKGWKYKIYQKGFSQFNN